jgi:hypothetical protein
VGYEGEEHSQHLYRADKESPLNLRTIYEPKPRNWLHERTKKVESIILVGYSSRLTHEEIKKVFVPRLLKIVLSTLSLIIVKNGLRLCKQNLKDR